MLLRQARRITCPLTGLVVCALLAGCMESRSASVGPGGTLAPAGAQASDLTAHSPAPDVPRDERSHGMFQSLTGINGDAVAAVQLSSKPAYVWFDPVAAKPGTVDQAPTRICAKRGSLVENSYITRPEDNAPGVQVLVVECLS
ncbi:hypothetical protein [Thioclava pacifica]|uniref:Ig-like domain-containing protein n=1 Tax=Thioclava pacifica DSM 10166 TaxID=1353537 RepID=A0A074J960_9RHOB|nr:hypothetical protein [Thioclava pacifica]KEO53079.1 hypothetical protein TP2_09060 [Thioclava pacifica DSM 10166]